MHELSDRQLQDLIEEATVDAYDEDEQLTGFYTMLVDHLAIPFETTVLGTSVTVDSVDLTPGSRIIAWCTRGPHRQAIAILDGSPCSCFLSAWRAAGRGARNGLREAFDS
ncbi:hypothetical protein ABIE67_009717 [Streptomyces sp. V4I8]|uniref:calcium-binding protein n=1 Tax=Streptomyces sp. V4I8 TaxID=3156469 RepID=UPI0035168751